MDPDAIRAGLPFDDPALVRALFDGSMAGIALFDDCGRHLTANQTMQRLLALPERRLAGRTLPECLPGPLGAEADALLRAVLAGAPNVKARELHGELPGLPGPRTVLVSFFRLVDAEGRPRAASIVVDVTDKHRAMTDLASAVGRLELLGRVADAFAESLDLDRTLDRLADLAVPALADHCLVDLVHPAGMRRVAARHAPDATPLEHEAVPVGDVVQYPPAHPASPALREPGPHLIDFDASRHDYAEASPTPPGSEFARRVGIHTAIVTALTARGRTVGLLLMARSVTRAPYTHEDAEIVGQIADRVAVSIDTALLFARQQETALRLQRSLMPRHLPEVDGVRLAARYRPAGDRAEVGGDWYDVVRLPAGRAALIIGDVMGRGLAAAALMGQVRAALRAYAVQDLPPADVLAHADELVRGLDECALVTCVYAVLDPRDRSLRIAAAGHVPALLVDAPGTGAGDVVTELPATGPPLGAGALSEGPRYGQRCVGLDDDATLVLFTDGLVERRDEPIDRGLARLTGVLRGLAEGPEGSLETWADQLPARLDPHDGDRDDVALLLVRSDAAGAPPARRCAFEPDPEQVRCARRTAVDAVRAWFAVAADDSHAGAMKETLADDVELLASELVTNVVRHARTSGELWVSLHPGLVVLEVRDGREATPRWRRADPDDEGGRGMFLVGGLAQDWGVRALSGGGKAVWCAVAVPPALAEAVASPFGSGSAPPH